MPRHPTNERRQPQSANAPAAPIARRPLGLNPPPFELFRVGRLAELLHVNRATIWRWRQSGVLPPFVKIGGVEGLTGAQVAQLLDQRSEAGR